MLRQLGRAVVLFPIPLLLCLFGSSAVYADSIPNFVLTSGSITMLDSCYTSGSNFIFSGPKVSIAGTIYNLNGCENEGVQDLLPGMVFAPGWFPFSAASDNGGGEANVDPNLYAGAFQSHFFLTAINSVTVPSTLEPLLQITSRLTLTQTWPDGIAMALCADETDSTSNCQIGAPTVTFSFQGTWTSTVTLNLHSYSLDPLEGPYYYNLQEAVYTLTPVPEPATLLLTGSGILGIVFRKRRSIS